MSIILRILLITLSVFLFVFVARNVKHSKMRIEDSLFWVLVALCILLLSIFPGVAYVLSDALGFMAPINMLFLFFIFLLLLKCFQLSKHVSDLEARVSELTQQIAIEQLRHFERRRADSGRQAEVPPEEDQDCR